LHDVAFYATTSNPIATINIKEHDTQLIKKNMTSIEDVDNDNVTQKRITNGYLDLRKSTIT